MLATGFPMLPYVASTMQTLLWVISRHTRAGPPGVGGLIAADPTCWQSTEQSTVVAL